MFNLLEKVVNRLDNSGVEDYSIENEIPRDTISYDISNNIIYLPKDYEYSQYNIDDYIRTNEPMDKAGAYGIQDSDFNLVNHIEGSFDNVIGLPVEDIKKHCF